MRYGPKKYKAKVVSKVRRTNTQAYGNRSSWQQICEAVKKRDGYKCRLCPCRNYLQVDHIIPVSKGGPTVMYNLWTLCADCHSKRPGHKAAKHLILYKKNQGGKR